MTLMTIIWIFLFIELLVTGILFSDLKRKIYYSDLEVIIYSISIITVGILFLMTFNNKILDNFEDSKTIYCQDSKSNIVKINKQNGWELKKSKELLKTDIFINGDLKADKWSCDILK